jgi:hypothetical protein
MDETISLENLKKFAETLGGKALENVTNYSKGIADSSGVTLKFSEVLKIAGKEATDSIHKLAEEAQNLFSSFLSLTSVGQEVKKAAFGATEVISDMFKKSDIGVSNLVMGTFDLLGVIDKNITGMGKLGDSGLEAGEKITTAFKSISPVLNNIFGSNSKIMNFSNAVLEGRDRVVSLERELISMALAQGRAADVTDQSAERFKDMSEAYVSYVNMSIKAAAETGHTVSSIMELNKALSSIPGSLSDAEQTVKVSRMAAAARMNELEAAKQVADMYTRLGTSEKDATEAMAYMHDKAGDSKLRMEAFNQTVLTVAGSFKMLGDNTNATTNFVGAFDRAFQDSKISPEAMKEVINSVGEGIAKMDTAKKAFISGATGGPGGLAGKFQIDELIATGHMDEVVKKTMTAMQSQFGGPVLTRKDAVDNPALAGELYKQMQYLTGVAGIAKNDEEAYRILEAMKTGVMDMLKPGAAEGEKGLALERQLGKGASLQEQTQTTMMKIHQTLEVARLRQDKFYNTEFKEVDKYLGSIAETMGLSNIRDNRSGRGAMHAGVDMLSHGKERDQMQKPDWSEMMGNAFSVKAGAGDIKSDFLSMLSGGKHTGVATSPSQHTMLQPPPGIEHGVSNIAPGHRTDLGLPALPEVHKMTLPTVPTPGANETTNPSAVEHSFKDMNVNLTIDLGDHKIFNEMIRAELQKDDEALNRQRATGRR